VDDEDEEYSGHGSDSEIESSVESDDDEAEFMRQAASNYHARQEAAQAATSSSMTGSLMPNRSAPELVPLDATLADDPSKPPKGVSVFRSRQSGLPYVPVTAIGPDSHNIIREGKLVDDKLMVPADSDSDDDGIGEAGRKIVALLRQRDDDHMAVAGPSQVAPQNRDVDALPSAKKDPPVRSPVMDVRERVGSSQPVASSRVPAQTTLPAKQSRFKALRQPTNPSAGAMSSPTPKPIRESPPTSPPTVMARAPTASISQILSPIAAKTPAVLPGPSPSLGPSAMKPSLPAVIDSPSFPRPANAEQRKSNVTRFEADAVMSKEVVERTQPKRSYLERGLGASR